MARLRSSPTSSRIRSSVQVILEWSSSSDSGKRGERSASPSPPPPTISSVRSGPWGLTLRYVASTVAGNITASSSAVRGCVLVPSGPTSRDGTCHSVVPSSTRTRTSPPPSPAALIALHTRSAVLMHRRNGSEYTIVGTAAGWDGLASRSPVALACSRPTGSCRSES